MEDIEWIQKLNAVNIGDLLEVNDRTQTTNRRDNIDKAIEIFRGWENKNAYLTPDVYEEYLKELYYTQLTDKEIEIMSKDIKLIRKSLNGNSLAFALNERDPSLKISYMEGKEKRDMLMMMGVRDDNMSLQGIYNGFISNDTLKLIHEAFNRNKMDVMEYLEKVNYPYVDQYRDRYNVLFNELDSLDKMSESKLTNMKEIFKYLSTKKIPLRKDTKLSNDLIDFKAYPYNDYSELFQLENYMRQNMYEPDLIYQKNEMNTNPHYNLIKITEDIYNDLLFFKDHHSSLLFQRRKEHTKRSWEDIIKDLHNLPNAKGSNILVAGGSVLAALLGTEFDDYDMFFYGLDESEAVEIIKDFICDLSVDQGLEKKVRRTKNTVSLIVGEYETNQWGWKKTISEEEFQFILRLYRTPSEILHGFDVDSSCIGWDGENLWATERFLYSMYKGYNTVNFDLMSPSYEFRLIKYGYRGIPVNVPGFSMNDVDSDEVTRMYEDYFQLWLKIETVKRLYEEYFKLSDEDKEDKASSVMEQINKLKRKDTEDNRYNYKFLKLLLVFNERHKYPDQDKWMKKTIERENEQRSDYEGLLFTKRVKSLSSLEDIEERETPEREIMGEITPEGIWVAAEEEEEEIPSLFPTRDDQLYQFVKIPYLSDWNGTGQETTKRSTIDIIETDELGSNCIYLDYILDIPEDVYQIFLDNYKEVILPQTMEFKTVNPGEQATGTYHRLVHENPDIWYNAPLKREGFKGL